MDLERTDSQLSKRQKTLAANRTFRQVLNKTFLSRLNKNPHYSLRAMAGQLKVDQSFLSKVLRGDKNFSLERIETLGLRLGLPISQVQSVVLNSKPSTYEKLDEDRFQMMADWIHFAILELAKTENFNSKPEAIGRRLGIHVEEARAALERLTRLGFIEEHGDGIRLLSPNNTWTSSNKNTTEARRNLQRRYLEKSLKALDEIDFKERDHGSLTVAINRKRLPEFKLKLMEIRRELGDYFQTDEEFDEVYQLTVSFFPLTQIKSDKGAKS
jgi:transcriptional regulator with XRE-family HTH domain